MPLSLSAIPAGVLVLFDELMRIRDNVVHSTYIQAVGALFFVATLFVAIALFVYWCCCVPYILGSSGIELTDEEMEEMRWIRKFREYLLNLLSFGHLTLP